MEAGDAYEPRRLHIEKPAPFRLIAAATLHSCPVIVTTDHRTLRTLDVTTDEHLVPNMDGHDGYIDSVALGTSKTAPSPSPAATQRFAYGDLDACEQLGPALRFPA